MALSFQDSVLSAGNPGIQVMTLAAESPDDPFQKLPAYADTWYDSYTDDKYSTVNSQKVITVNPDQPNLTQEENSQLIPFEMPRYYDGIDLSQMIIQIHFVNPKGDEFYVSPVNVTANSEKIRFGWLVDATATAFEGKLQFEIKATGTNERGLTYVWRTKTNNALTVEKSLSGNGLIQPDNYSDWYTQFERSMNAKVEEAKAAARDAETAAQNAVDIAAQIDAYSKDEVDALLQDVTSLSNLGASYANDVLTLYDKSKNEADPERNLAEVNISTLSNLKMAYTSDSNGVTTLSIYNGDDLIQSLQMNIVPSATWQSDFASSVGTTTDNKISAALEPINTDLAGIHNAIDDLPETLQSDYYTKTEVDSMLENAVTDDKLDEMISANEEFKKLGSRVNEVSNSLTTVDGRVDTVETRIAEVAASATAHNTYDMRYDTEKNQLKLFENVSDPDAEGAIPKTTLTITGGSGGQQTGSTLTITRITPDTVTEKSDAPEVIIRYNFRSVMADGDTNSITGTATWRVGSTTVATEQNLQQGDLSFDIRGYLSVGTNLVTLSFLDSEGNQTTRRWTINLINFDIQSAFDDTLFYDGDIAFRYTPNGNVSKDIHFVLDGNEIATVTTNSTAKQLSQTIAKQSHGAHLLDLYMTATINNKAVESNHIYKDIIFVDEEATMPIISCPVRSISAKQYNTTVINYTVYDPLSNPATVKLYVDGAVVSTLSATRAAQQWSFKSDVVGDHKLKIEVSNTAGTTFVEISATIIDIGINVEPVTDNLVFDFSPAGHNNADENRIWTDGTYHMTVSDNFDWANGGYQLDSDGDTYFCVKAGTTVSFDVPLFGDEAKTGGKNFKFIYRTNNVRDYDAKVLRCMSDGIGLEMNAQNAILHSQQNSIEAPYCEDNFMEFEFNILPSTHFREMVLWLDAIPTRVKLYETTDSFTQIPVVPITVGSDDCDVWIYRMKSYSVYLEEDQILENFIADAKNAEEMIRRYERNDILNDAAQLDPDLLAERCPNLRIIKLSAPYFTNDKDNKVSGTTVQHIYKNGRAVEDNWIATGGIHKGQGTSSNYYGDSARNIDIDFRKAYNVEAGTGFLYGDNTLHDKYAMTENSVPEAYFNIKLNVASSENANNAVLADEYNLFNPYVRPAREADPRVRDTMEFHPCVVFIKETDPDLSTHREFQDNEWHFYGCGDFGNSKKNNGAMGMTDDPAEFIMEINNNINAQCRWLSDDVSADGDPIKWGSKTSFQFRYIQDEDDADMINAAAAIWKNALTWVVNQNKNNVLGQLADLDAAVEAAAGDPDAVTAATTARDSYITEFKTAFENIFQADNLCYSYLFTERHLMIDNRAKNTFWHYDPTTKKISCTFDYDNDTAEGNDNEGGLTLRYGLEDTDTIGTKDVFNAADSFIWKLIKNFYRTDLAEMYRDLENEGAWSATRFLNKMDAYQSVKPERLWIMDMQRKYFRPYEEGGVTEETDDKPSTTAYLEMMHGSKKHQRRQFEKYQEKYIASKYVGATATSDVMTLRTYTPTEWTGVEPNTTFHITPYADTYIVVLYGSHQVQVRAKRGQSYTITAPAGVALNDTETYTYNASMLQSLGDLSGFYPGYVNLAGGVKLRDLLIGSNVNGYQNTNFTAVSVSSNPLLEKLNIENLPNLKSSINVESCVNMTEFLADGSGITGVVFPTGGKLKTAYLPASVTSITAKSLNYVTDLQIASYANITTLVIENSPSIDSLDLVNKCAKLNTARLTGINWTLDDEAVLERLYNMSGQDENHNVVSRAVVSGHVDITTIRERNLNKYREAWPNLTIEYTNMIRQFAVEFYNADGTLIERQYVDVNDLPTDPSATKTPTMEPTISTVYTFDGWDHTLVAVTGNQVYTAVYAESPRRFTVTYTDGFGTVLQKTTNAPYGAYVTYTGVSGEYSDNASMNVTGTTYTAMAEAKQSIIPKYTSGESANNFYLFREWDKSGYVDGYSSEGVVGDKTINALYDTFQFVSSGNINSFTDDQGNWKSLSDLSMVELYALTKLEEKHTITVNNGNDDDSDDFIAIGDEIEIQLGSNTDYNDIDSHDFVQLGVPLNLNGRACVDASVTSSHRDYAKPLAIDQDFVIALEYSVANNSPAGSVLFQCYDDFSKAGLQIVNNNGVTLNWYGSTLMIGSAGMRDLVVLRHKKGDKSLYVYTANLSGNAVGYNILTNNTAGSALLDMDIVIGCAKNVTSTSYSYDNYSNGTVYWCKIWMGDLGDAICRDIASWTHEVMTFKVAKYKDYYKPNRSKVLFTFMANNLLPVGRALGATKWHEAPLNEYLQKRIFFAFPIQWQAILAEAMVTAWDGMIVTTTPRGTTTTSLATTTTSGNCFIQIPCAAEVDATAAADQYYSRECNNGQIKFMSTASSLNRAYPDGESDSYWTRSASQQYPDYVGTVSYSYNTDTSSVSYWESFSNTLGILIMFHI